MTTNYNTVANLASVNYYGPVSLVSGNTAIRMLGTVGFLPAIPFGYCMEFTANCTQLSIYGFSDSSTSTFQLSVDGGAYTNIAGTNSYSTIVLATGLAAGNHLFRLSVSSNNYLITIILTGGTEAITSIAKTQVPMVSGITARTLSGASPVATFGAYTITSPSILAGSYVGQIFECQLSGTDIELLGVTDNFAQCAVSVDGGTDVLVPTGSNSPLVNNQYSYFPLATGLTPGVHTLHAQTIGYPGGAKQYLSLLVKNGTSLAATASSGASTIVVVSAAAIATGDWLMIDSFLAAEPQQVASVVGTTVTLVGTLATTHTSGAAVNNFRDPAGSIASWTSTSRTSRLVGIGDSVTEGGIGTSLPGSTYDPRNSYLGRAGAALSMQVINLGIQGQTTAQMTSRSADFSTYGANPTYVVLFAGINDANTNVTSTTFQTNYQALVNAAKTAYPNVPLYCVALFTPIAFRTVPNSAGLKLSDYNAIIQRIVSGSGAQVQYIDLSVGLNLSVYNASTNPSGDLVDGLHPYPSGHIKMARTLQLYLTHTLSSDNTMTGTTRAAGALTPTTVSGGVTALNYPRRI